jgi:hypothetical protein
MLNARIIGCSRELEMLRRPIAKFVRAELARNLLINNIS